MSDDVGITNISAYGDGLARLEVKDATRKIDRNCSGTTFLTSGLSVSARDSFKDLALPEVWQGEKETLFGPMLFDHGMPLRDSAEMLNGKLDAYRATELFLWSQPIVSFAPSGATRRVKA